MATESKPRCPWVNLDNPLYVEYHDKEWGKPVHDDNTWFEFLILEGAQAGLSWETILKKREGYRKAFAGFDPKKVARFTKLKQEKLLTAEIVRNRLKIASAIQNAKAFLKVQEEFGTFNKYVRGFVGKPISNSFKSLKDYPTQTELSAALSKDLKKRRFNFVGPTIMYAFMQATGLVDDHTVDCYKRKPWYVYIIECKDKSLYTGITTDVKARFNTHVSAKGQAAKYLKGKGPLTLLFHKKVGNKSQASKVEAAIKKLTKTQKLSLVQTGKLPAVS